MPFCSLLLNEGGSLKFFLPDFIQLINLQESLLLGFIEVHANLYCSPEGFDLEFYGEKYLLPIHQLIGCMSCCIPPGDSISP
jgi:hypothetical protein